MSNVLDGLWDGTAGGRLTVRPVRYSSSTVPTSQRTSPRSGGAAARRSSASGRARPSSRRAPSRPLPLANTRAFFGEHLGRQADDVWGLVLILCGVLVGLGIFFDLTGPFGRAVRSGTGALLGTGRVLVPFALIAVGYVLVRGRPREEPVRVVIGSAFLVVAATGLLHLRSGGPAWGSNFATLRTAGGLLGAAIGEPLQKVLATWGAVLVLSLVGLLGCLILLRLRVRDAVNRTADGIQPVGAAARRGVYALLSLRGSDVEARESARRHPTARRSDRIGWRGREDDGARYRVPGYDDVLGLPDFNDGPDEPPTPTKKPRKKSGQSVGEGSNGTVVGADGAVIDLAAAEDASLTAARVPITLPPEPVWTEDQPHTENVPLPGIVDRPSAKPAIVWKLPPRALLKKGKAIDIDKRAVEAGGRTLEEALAAHGVETRLVGMTVGPTVTRYELELAPGVKVAKVTALHKDIAYAMATADVRILAPIPGKSAIGVEVPNRQRQLVAVGDVLHTPDAKAFTGPLSVAVGRDIDGKPVIVDLAKMPHVLVAGTTGSGKSSCINSLLASILMRSTPDEVRLILIDPKMVELSQYNGLPHLLTQVVTNPKKAANALQWAVDEMERRYEMLAKLRFRDIGGYNAAVEKGDLEDPYAQQHGSAYAIADDPAGGIGLPPAPKHSKLSYILVVVDELADLMMVAARDVEESICRIAQKARAVGIHLVIATQRPSVNVITGLIKANVPSRFAFAVSSLTDSRVILDSPGAERLIGQGDMLMVTVSSNVPLRVQGNFVSEEEVRGVVNFWTRQAGGMSRTLPGVDAGEEPGVKLATSGFVDFTATGDQMTFDSDHAHGVPGPAPFPDLGGSLDVPTAPPVIGSPFAYGGSDELVGSKSGGSLLGGDDDGDGDDMLDTAMELIVRSQLGSTSMLQRKLRVGFSRAGRIMDLLERKGIVGPSVGSKPRDVLMTVEELEALMKRRG